MRDGHSCDGGSPSFPGSALLPGFFARMMRGAGPRLKDIVAKPVAVRECRESPTVHHAGQRGAIRLRVGALTLRERIASVVAFATAQPAET